MELHYRKKICAACREEIKLTFEMVNNGDILYRKNSYYHKECFVEMIKNRMAELGGHSVHWQEVLNNLDEYAKDARQRIENYHYREALNLYLLARYPDVGKFSSQFWLIIESIGNGIYKTKRCKPIDCKTLLDMWKYFEKKLDKLYEYNKSNGKNMDSEVRTRYDLSCIIAHYSEYTKAKEREQQAKIIASQIKEEEKIDYTRIPKPKREKKRTFD